MEEDQKGGGIQSQRQALFHVVATNLDTAKCNLQDRKNKTALFGNLRN